MQHIDAAHTCTVIWQRSRGSASVVQNLCRLMAEGYRQGPPLHNVFATDRFEGFQTDLSQPPRSHSEPTLLPILGAKLNATEYLEQEGKPLAFQFEVPDDAHVGVFGSSTGDGNVWAVDPLTSEEQKAARNKHCRSIPRKSEK